jgi:hypothetical protein
MTTKLTKKEKKMVAAVKQSLSNTAGTRRRRRRRNRRARRGMVGRTEAPLAVNAPFQYGHPKIMSGVDFCIVKHKEYLGDLRFPVDGESFDEEAIISYLGNPADPDSFPWLSQIAKMYEKYRFKRVIYHFRPYKSADKSGQIILVPFYDVLDEDPESKEQFMQSPHALMSKLWANASCVAIDNGTPMKVEKYTRYHPISTGQDAKTYDEYKFFVYMQQSSEEIEPVGGTLEVEYEVELYKPRPNPGEVVVFDWNPNAHTGDDLFDPTKLDQVFGQQTVRSVKPGSIWNVLEFVRDFTGHMLTTWDANDGGTPHVALNGPGNFNAIRVNNASGTKDVSYLMGSLHARAGTQMVVARSGTSPHPVMNNVKLVLGTMLKDFFTYWLPATAVPMFEVKTHNGKIRGVLGTRIINGMYVPEKNETILKVFSRQKHIDLERLEKSLDFKVPVSVIKEGKDSRSSSSSLKKTNTLFG